MVKRYNVPKLATSSNEFKRSPILGKCMLMFTDLYYTHDRNAEFTAWHKLLLLQLTFLRVNTHSLLLLPFRILK